MSHRCGGGGVSVEYVVSAGRATTIFAPTERKARNQIKKLLADQSWRKGFQGNTDIGLSTIDWDAGGAPVLIDAIDVPDDAVMADGSVYRLAEPVNRHHQRSLRSRA